MESWSLSSRRAWIEIYGIRIWLTFTIKSLSSRRAWIEIGTKILIVWRRKRRSPHGERGLKFLKNTSGENMFHVALLTESVDWNVHIIELKFFCFGRSPHGERGLKCDGTWFSGYSKAVALLTESVDWNLPLALILVKALVSLSSRRAWIEMWWYLV